MLILAHLDMEIVFDLVNFGESLPKSIGVKEMLVNIGTLLVGIVPRRRNDVLYLFGTLAIIDGS